MAIPKAAITSLPRLADFKKPIRIDLSAKKEKKLRVKGIESKNILKIMYLTDFLG